MKACNWYTGTSPITKRPFVILIITDEMLSTIQDGGWLDIPLHNIPGFPSFDLILDNSDRRARELQGQVAIT
jgi:hypothetical protein